MTETPNGPRDPAETNLPSSPQPERPPYAGPEWRRPDAPDAPTLRAEHGAASAGDATSDDAGSRPTPGSQDASGAEAAPGFRDPAGAEAARGFQDAPGSQAGPGASTGAQTAYPTGAPAAGGYPSGAHGGYATGAQVGQYATGAQPGSSGEAGSAPGSPSYQPGPWNGGPYGQPQYGASRPGTPYGNGAPWPYAAPEPKKKGAGRRLLTGGVLAAVLGGLAGGGLVAALDRNDTTTAGGITIQGSSAPAAQNQSGSVEAAAATAMKSVVTLSVRGSQEAGTGSGIVIRSDGYVLTNEHVTAVADGGGTITVAFADGRTASAKLVGADKETDLAVVKMNLTGLTAATFADSDAIKVGQTVVAVGSPLGLNGTVTEGIVSALHRPTSGASDNSAVIDAIQTDAAINPGNSGGALVDLAGRVVGINQSIATAGSGGGGFGQPGGAGNIGIGFAIPADTAARISQQLITSGKATHALLGVQTRTATSTDQATAIGATIAQVTPGEAAADAGIKAGDVVTKVNDRVIGQSEDLAATIRSYAPGTKVTLTIKRGNDTSTVTVTLGSDAGH
jgi:putative serine protease PepD